MTVRDIHSRREMSRLAAGFVAATEAAGARCVLVTAVSGRDGVGTVVPGLVDALSEHSVRPIRFMRWGWLQKVEPFTLAPSEMVIVLGPPMLEGDDFLELPQAWMEQFDASVLVVSRRGTRRDDLAVVTRWLRDAGLPPIGVVVNAAPIAPVRFLESLRTSWKHTRERWTRAATEGPPGGPGPSAGASQ
ncbi:MAG: hypothetical protein R3F39_08790 [Myxococcota bacterium]